MPNLINPPQNVREAYDAFMAEYIGEPGSNKAIATCAFSTVGIMDPNFVETDEDVFCLVVLLYKEYLESELVFPKEYMGVKVFTKIVNSPKLNKLDLPQTHDARKQISTLRRECFLSYRDISVAAGVSVRAIRNCERYNVLVAEARVRIDELYNICRLLSEIVEKRYMRKWLREPQEIFSGKSPLELIKESRTEELKKVINELLNESFS